MRISSRTLLVGITPALLVVAAAFLTSLVFRRGSGAAAPALGAPVQLGRDYYLFVPLVELTEKRPDGSNWDSGSSSAPDIYVEVYWQGHRIFQSSTKPDTFIGKWSNTEVDIRDLALRRKASVEDTLAAARFNVKEGDVIEIRVYDEDALGMGDLAGSLRIEATELRVGEEIRLLTGDGIKRIVLRVLPLEELPELLK